MAGQILIVDDHDFVRRGLRSLLSTRPEWAICGEAADGLEAIEKAKILRPDVVLMDISMPRMNGLEASRIIRREVPESKIVIVSQIDPSIAGQKTRQVDVTAYVAKSDLGQHLLPMLERILGRPPAEGKTELRQATSFSAGWLAGGGELGGMIRERDWSQTPLGPLESWPQSLRTSASICVASRFPIVLYWGPEFVVLYNDAYSAILGSKHPWALGQRCRDCWAEIWDTIGPMLEGVVRTGEATWSDDLLLVLHRYGYAEECYFSFSFSPVRVEEGVVGGVFTAVIETTDKVIGERRLRTLQDLAAKAVDAKSEEDACRIAAETLSENLRDIPFSALCAGADSGFQVLCGSGIPANHPLRSLISEAGSTVGEKLRQVRDSGQPLEVDLQALGCELPQGAWDAPPCTALLMPVPAVAEDGSPGVLVCAVSPKKKLDENYRTFFSLVNRQIASSIADARSHEEERKRAEALAEIDRAKTLFFSNVSHEFRTPLTLMLGPIEEALYGGKLPPQNYAQLMMVHRNGLRLLKLVNTLLDFSRIEAGRVQAVYEPTDLASLTADLASVFRSTVERAGLGLVVDCPALSEPVYVDRDMWEKIVLNLISNAFKFTLQGEIAVELKPLGKAWSSQSVTPGWELPRKRCRTFSSAFTGCRMRGRGRTRGRVLAWHLCRSWSDSMADG